MNFSRNNSNNRLNSQRRSTSYSKDKSNNYKSEEFRKRTSQGTFSYNNNNRKREPKRTFSENKNTELVQLKPEEIRIIPLGGQGELGKSTWIFETSDQILIVDAGKGYAPYNVKGGMETLANNKEYLKKNKDKIKALIISNPHEEYSGDLVSFLEELEVQKVYIPELLINFFKSDLENKNLIINKIPTDHEKIKITEEISFKAYKSSFVSADSFCLLIEIKGFKVFYSAAFKITHYSPILENSFELNQIAYDLSNKGVDLLISGSQGVEKSGYSKSESDIEDKFRQIFFEQAKNRIIIITGCSYTHRFKLLIELSKFYQRKVCFIGKQTSKWLSAMIKSKYITEEDLNLLLKPEDLAHSEASETLVIMGEEEGRGIKPFLDLSYRKHPDFDLEENDIVVISIDPSLGTTRLIANAIDQTFLQGVKVIGGRDAGVQAGNHACQEELKFMYNLTKPKFFIPSHGEIRQIVTHGRLLSECGLDPKRVIILDNGNLLDFNLKSNNYAFTGQIPVTPVYASNTQGIIDQDSLKQRFLLAEDGLLNIFLAIDFEKKTIIAGPELEIFGSVLLENPRWNQTRKLIDQEIQKSVQFCFELGPKVDKDFISKTVKESLIRIIRKISGMVQPVISVIIQRIN